MKPHYVHWSARSTGLPQFKAFPPATKHKTGKAGPSLPCYATQTAAEQSAGANGSGPQSAEVPQDLMQRFAKTQRNLLEVNRSRLDALQELGAAQARIAELEQQLRTVEQSSNAELSAPPAQPPVEEPTEQDDGGSSAAASPVQTAITLAYQTGWHRAFLHYCADRKGWTQYPGKEMLPGTGPLSQSRVLTVEAQHLEFVINNGSNDWDTPDPYGVKEQKNYVINGQGRYRLQSGKVLKLE
ncbi:hypothetical protein WJX73_003705 [Symbiochloris irregularis]|uniref:Carbohydrate binding module family 25 domain-containing protein n=1 Tax=Symbiochloris irregularis TaxID=706552 RepID=A0AAW1NXU6_9CHLO